MPHPLEAALRPSRTLLIPTPAELVVLRAGSLAGITVHYATRWMHDGRFVTSTVKRLLEKGWMDAMYFRDGKAAANITDKGRQALSDFAAIQSDRHGGRAP